MGKKSASKDRAYQTATEWRTEGGGHAGRLQGAAGDFRRLPFSACAISFQPFDDPVATADGTVFDIVNAVPYVQKFRRHPATGAPLELKDLVRLHFHRNADGEFACPVLGKVFNEHTHIVAVRTSGNVYCWEALDQLCLKPRNLRDLLTDEPFARADVIHIQDPQNLGNRNLAAFDHVVKSLRVEDEAERAAREADPMFGIRHVDADTRRALDALGSGEAGAALAAGGGGRKAQAERLLADAKAAAAAAAGAAGGAPAAAAAAAGSDPRLRSAPASGLGVTFKPGTSTWNTDAPAAPAPAAAAGGKAAPKDDPSAGRPVPAPYSQRYVAHHTSTGAASRSLTSSSQAVAIRNERTMVLQELKPDKKGYLRLHTTLGDLNLELHADIAPRTCENFMALAEGGYYTGTRFHRSIKNFMAQGGDPTGTGAGGASVFGAKFGDEFDARLLHAGRGVVAMANSGPGTNGSQFYILYKSAHHLDFKHTVFARVVGGFETLTAMERVPTDSDDRPLQPIEITGVELFVNPYRELLEAEAKAAAAAKRKADDDEEGPREYGAWFSNPAAAAAANAAPAMAAARGGQGGAAAPALPAAEALGGGGVGKYLKLPPAIAAAAGGGGDGAPAKKQKVAKVELSNFDAW